MELERGIYWKLLAWKARCSHKVSGLEGVRQVGKTYNKVAVFRTEISLLDVKKSKDYRIFNRYRNRDRFREDSFFYV